MSNVRSAGRAMKRVLISGAKGFVGSHVLAWFHQHTDWEMVCPLGIPIAAIPDLGDFDVIVHLAAIAHVGRSIAEPVLTTLNTIGASLAVLEYARAHPVERFVQLSTDEIYGDCIVDDWGRVHPRNPYAAAKVAQEALAIAYHESYGIPVSIVTADIILGTGQPADKFVPTVSRAVLAGEEVPIFAVGGRIGSRYYVPASNAAEMLRWICAQPPKGLERWALGGGERLNNLELARRVAMLLDKPLHHRLEYRPGVRMGIDHHRDGLVWPCDDDPPTTVMATLASMLDLHETLPAW